MRCEVIAVGTELLLGQTVDTNSSWIGEQLALAGVDSHFQTKVGDNLGRMVSTLQLALSRSEAVIMCGGLGPTQDDITREAIADVMGVSLIRDQALGEKIRALFERRGRTMAANNLRQADVPEGACLIKEMPGTAPGLICPVKTAEGEKVVYAVPGVPHEMRAMVSGTILPDLRSRAGKPSIIRSRVLKTWGLTESGLAELLDERIQALDTAGNPTLAFQASGIEGIKVRITAKASDPGTADRLIADEEALIRPLIGDAAFGADAETMESVVLDLLRGRGLTLAVAEAVTGGLVGARLTAVPGSSEVFKGGIVTAAPSTSRDILAVAEGRAVSPEAAEAMAVRVQSLLAADIGLATAGVSGEQGGRRGGTVFLGYASAGGSGSREVRLPGDRDRVRQYAVISLLDLLRRHLLQSDQSPVWMQ